MKKKLQMMILVTTLSSMGLMGEELVVNPGFEPAADDKTGELRAWGKIPAPYRLLPRGGRNGTAALYFERKEPGSQDRLLQEVKVKPGLKYKYHCWIKIEDIAGSKTDGASAGFLYFDKNGRKIGSHARPGVKGSKRNGKWLCHAGTTRPVPAGTVKAFFGPFVHDGLTGKAWFDDLMVQPVDEKPVDVLLSSAYRNGAVDGHVTFIALLNLLTNDTPIASLRGTFSYCDSEGRQREVAADSIAFDEARLTVDVKSLKPGEQDVEFRLVRKDDMRSLGSVTLKFTRFDTLPKRHVHIDPYGRTIVNGKPFFPLGVFAGKVSGEKLETLADSPFNCVMSYEHLSRDEIDALYGKGIYTIYNLCNAWVGDKTNPTIRTKADEEPWIRSKVASLKDHPGLLAWYTNDEKPSSMRDQLIARRNLLERLDPGHPTWSVLFQVLEMRSYFPTVDVIGSDPYPVPMYDLNTGFNYAKMTRDGTCGMRAFWQVPQIFDWAIYGEDHGSTAPPTLFEMRSLAWQSIVGGANGLVFFSFGRLYNKINGHSFETRWPDVKYMGEEIRRYIPAMLSVEKTPVVSTPNPYVPVRTWRHEGKTYLLVVNAQKDKKRFDGAIAVEGGIGKVDTGFGPAPTKADSALLHVSLAPYEPAMYILD